MARQAISSAAENMPVVDRVIDDPDEFDALPPPNPLDTDHLPSDEDLLRVRLLVPRVSGRGYGFVALRAR